MPHWFSDRSTDPFCGECGADPPLSLLGLCPQCQAQYNDEKRQCDEAVLTPAQRNHSLR